MPPHALTPTPKTYAQLRDAVTAVVVQGRNAIDRAWLETYHETGRLIHEHVLLFRDRADYGARTLEKLAADTSIHRRTLQECLQFYRCFPIWRDRAKLGWTHYRLLVQVADAAQRKALEAAAIKHDWTSTELETRVRSFNAVALADDDEPTTTPEKPIELLKPRCGIAGLRRLVDRPEGLSIDLGFKNYAAVPFATKSKTQSKVEGLRAGPSTSLRAGAIVEYGVDPTRSTELRAGPDIRVVDASQNQLFTYRATVRKIVDGDTLDITLTLAPGFTRDLKLRLRGIDCPEMDTAAGRAAKAFVARLLAPGDEVIVCTTKPDKYDRYLADVFVRRIIGQGSEIIGQDESYPLSPNTSRPEDLTFLNNALLASRHAIRYDGD